jgi:hypothetical protein
MVACVASGVVGTATLTANPAHAEDVVVGGAEPPARPAPAPAPVIVQIDKDRHAPRIISDWNEGEPIPTGYHPVQRVRKGAIIGGAVPFGILYFISALTAAVAHDANQGRDHSADGLFVPVAGPFITMPQTSSATANVFLALDGLGQAAGAALVIYGLVSPQTVLLRDDVGAARLLPHPILVGRGGAGLGWGGTF